MRGQYTMGYLESNAGRFSAQYNAGTHVYGKKLETIRALSGGNGLRLNIVNPSLMRHAALGDYSMSGHAERESLELRIDNKHGIPGLMFQRYIDRGIISISGDILHADRLADHLERNFYLRSGRNSYGGPEFSLRTGEEENAQNIFRAVLGRLAGKSSLIPRYGVFEGEVIDAVHILLTAAQTADGFWHPPLEEWNERKLALDHRGISIDLSGVTLRNKDLSGADFNRVILTGSDLEFSDLSEADLAFADVRYSYMLNTDLRGAVCTGLSAAHADLRFADLGEADARNADFSWANMENANLESGNFSGADFNGTLLMFSRPLRALFYGARLNGTFRHLETSMYDAAVANHSEQIYDYMLEIASLCSCPSAVMGRMPGRPGFGLISGIPGASPTGTGPFRTNTRLKEMVRAVHIAGEMRRGTSSGLSEAELNAEIFTKRLEADGETTMADYLVQDYISAIVSSEMEYSFYSNS